jgi:hypothetical protein
MEPLDDDYHFDWMTIIHREPGPDEGGDSGSYFDSDDAAHTVEAGPVDDCDDVGPRCLCPVCVGCMDTGSADSDGTPDTLPAVDACAALTS